MHVHVKKNEDDSPQHSKQAFLIYNRWKCSLEQFSLAIFSQIFLMEKTREWILQSGIVVGVFFRHTTTTPSCPSSVRRPRQCHLLLPTGALKVTLGGKWDSDLQAHYFSESMMGSAFGVISEIQGRILPNLVQISWWWIDIIMVRVVPQNIQPSSTDP